MELIEIPKGSVIELEINKDGEKKSISVNVEDTHDKSLLLEVIRLDSKIVGFDDDQITVNLCYVVDSKANIWKDVKVTPVRFSGKIYHAVTSENPSEILNRRGAYRVYIGKEMYVTTFSHTGPKSISALVKDVSETGFAFITSEAYENGSLVRLQLEIASDKALRLSSRIVRTVPRDDGTFLYGCEFSERNHHLSTHLMKLQQDKQKSKLAGNSAVNENNDK